VYFPLYHFRSFTENMFVVNNCTRLKYTFGIREIIVFKGMPLWSRVWIETVIIFLQWEIYGIDSLGEEKW
jgi:hypothetical protein